MDLFYSLKSFLITLYLCVVQQQLQSLFKGFKLIPFLPWASHQCECRSARVCVCSV